MKDSTGTYCFVELKSLFVSNYCFNYSIDEIPFWIPKIQKLGMNSTIFIHYGNSRNSPKDGSKDLLSIWFSILFLCLLKNREN